MSWRERKAFIGGTNYTEHTVAGETLKFFPVSVGTTFELRRLAKPLAKALSALFAPAKQDIGIIERVFEASGEEPGGKITENEPIHPELAKVRSKEREDGVASLVDALLDPKNGDVIGKVIMDCLREEFPRGRDAPHPNEFMRELELPTLVELLKGCFKSNKEVLGPLAQGADVAPVLKAVGQKLNQSVTAG